MNKFYGVGNLTRDPEYSQTPNGISVCKFALACNRNYVNASGEREVDFFNIVTWRSLADNCAKYLHKGSKIALSGPIQIRDYKDKNGNKRTSVEVIAEDIEFLGGKNTQEEKAPPKQEQTQMNLSGLDNKRKSVAELKPTDEPLPF